MVPTAWHSGEQLLLLTTNHPEKVSFKPPTDLSLYKKPCEDTPQNYPTSLASNRVVRKMGGDQVVEHELQKLNADQAVWIQRITHCRSSGRGVMHWGQGNDISG